MVYAALPISFAGNVREFLAGVKLQWFSVLPVSVPAREAKRLQRHELGVMPTLLSFRY